MIRDKMIIEVNHNMRIENIKSRILDVLDNQKPKGDLVTTDYFSRFIRGCTSGQIYAALEQLVEEGRVSKKPGRFLRRYPGYKMSGKGA
ncbi:MAG: hypothetical protein ACFE7S_08550 [Candidatus Hodarchaeota archaeon]